MPLRIQSDQSSTGIQRFTKINNKELSARIAKLASGLRIRQAADDAAGLTISEGLRADISGYAQAVRNSEMAINQTQVTEGALNETHAILGRLRELSASASNSTLTDGNRASIQAEFSQLTAELDRLAQSVPSGSETFQIGPNADSGNRVQIDVTELTSSSPQINLASASVATQSGAQSSLNAIDNAIAQVSVQRGDIGALQNRLGFAIRSNEQALENVHASESVIRDADIALETSALASRQIQSRANISILAQQNVNRQQVLNLLG